VFDEEGQVCIALDNTSEAGMRRMAGKMHAWQTFIVFKMGVARWRRRFQQSKLLCGVLRELLLQVDYRDERGLHLTDNQPEYGLTGTLDPTVKKLLRKWRGNEQGLFEELRTHAGYKNRFPIVETADPDVHLQTDPSLDSLLASASVWRQTGGKMIGPPAALLALPASDATEAAEAAKADEAATEAALEKKLRRKIRTLFGKMDTDTSAGITKDELVQFYMKSGADPTTDENAKKQLEAQWAKVVYCLLHAIF
jgi:hypothetical protein